MPPSVRLAEEEALYENGETRYDDGGTQQGEPEAAEIGRKCVCQIGAQHIEGGMGDVQDPHHAEDKGEAGGYEKGEHSVDEAMDPLDHVDRPIHQLAPVV